MPMTADYAIPGYRLLGEIHESVHSVAFRARRELDDLPVVIKILKEDYPPIEEVVKYKQEYEIATALKDIRGVVQLLGLEHCQNKLALVVEDFGADSLKKLLEARTLSLGEALTISIKIVECLGEIHAAHVIHKDINPSNIIYNPQTEELKIIDFGIASLLPQEARSLERSTVWNGTPAYVSPEQTGSVSFPLDFRTDYYSLGVTLYELLTGRKPFEAEDLADLMNHHASKQPVPPHKITPEVPEILSHIVLKLMSKNPDMRYQSAQGLRADLAECLDQLHRQGKVTLFALGASDFSDRLLIPDKLYGREKEFEELLSTFERAASGTSELVLISGYSGVGKTVLANQLILPLSKKAGYFLSGKFDQLLRNRPYTAFVDAFSILVQQLLGGSDQRLDALKQELDTTLGRNFQFLLDLIPGLKQILGPATGQNELPPTERQSRFNIAFQKLIAVLASPEHPLVLFLDDLQWADVASMKLLELLMTSPERQSLLVIGAYRDNEVGPAHPLQLTLNDLTQAQCRISHLTLSPLRDEHVTQLLSDALRCDAEMAAPLAALLCAKTDGNPFFLKEYLHSMYRDGLLVINLRTGVWDWEMDRIKERRIADNVAELMAGRIQKLSSGAQEVLKLAACVGNQFDLETLAIVQEKTPREALKPLHEAAVTGLMVPLSHAYKAIAQGELDPSKGAAVEFKFAHDRIQQAAYSLIPPVDRPSYHYRIGTLLRPRLSPDGNDPRLFSVVNHLNLGRDCLSEAAPRDELAHLNLLAGRRAKAAAAYHQALIYLEAALALAGPAGWERDHALALSLTEEAAEAAYLCTDYPRMDQYVREILAGASTVLEHVRAYQLRIAGYAAERNPREAVKTALAILRLLGERFPENPSRLRVILDFVRTKIALSGRRIEALLDRPEMADPQRRAALDIMRSISFALYIHNPNLYALFVFHQFRMLLRHGHNIWSGSVFASFGTILCGVVGDTETGYKIGKLAQELNERFHSIQQKCRTDYLFNVMQRHWKEHLRNSLQPLQGAYQVGLETGDINFSALSALSRGQYSFYAGDELMGLEGSMATYSQAIQKLKQESQFGYSEIFRQCVLNLVGGASDPCKLVGEAFDEDKSLPILEKANDRTGIAAIYFCRLFLCNLFQQYPQAAQYADLAEQYEDATRGQFGGTRLVFYACLAWLGFYQTAPSAKKRRLLKKVGTDLKKLKLWARLVPANHLHAYALVEAERCRVRGMDSQAAKWYERAIRNARENGFLHEEALAKELATRFHQSRGRNSLARTYLQDAHYTYLKWGALAKVQDMERQHSGLNPARRTNPGRGGK